MEARVRRTRCPLQPEKQEAPSFRAGSSHVDRKTIAGLEAAAAIANLQPIEGGRLVLRPFPTVAAKSLASVTARLTIVPWPRIYADLRIVGVRGEEAAEHLREVIRAR